MGLPKTNRKLKSQLEELADRRTHLLPTVSGAGQYGARGATLAIAVGRSRNSSGGDVWANPNWEVDASRLRRRTIPTTMDVDVDASCR